VFMFQPGEEGQGGARLMVEEGVLDAAGDRVVAAYAMHVMSAGFPSGVIGTRAGTMLSACDTATVTVTGAGGHGSLPHQAADPVPAMCEMVIALQTMVTRQFDIFDPVVVTVGSFHSGTKENIIPETAHFDATVRTFSAEAGERMRPLLVGLIEGIAKAHGLEVEVAYDGLYPATVNDAQAIDIVRDTVGELFGPERFETMAEPLAGAEDFSRVLQQVPGAMVFLGATIEGRDHRTSPWNHSPEAAFDDRVLPDGATLLARLALDHLAA